MRLRTMFASLLVSLLVASVAHAGGVNLRWDNCASDGGVANQNFACNTNSSNHVAVASFVLPASQSGVSGVEVYFDLSVASVAVPAWWDFTRPGGCRLNSLSANPTFNPLDLICQDWALGQAVGGLAAYTIGTFGPSTARIVTAVAVATNSAADLQTGPEYFVENLVIGSQKTLGTGACSGCSTPACLALESIRVDTGNTLQTVLTEPANGTDSNFATWQGGAGVPPLPGGACPAVVPTRNSTWSSVKSLYR